MNYQSFDNGHKKHQLPMKYKSYDQENEIKDLFDQIIISSKILDNHDSLEFLKRKEIYFLSLEIDVYEKNKIKKKIKKYYQTSNYILKLFFFKILQQIGNTIEIEDSHFDIIEKEEFQSMIDSLK